MLIGTNEAGDLLGISSTAVVRLIQRGTLPAARLGYAYVIRESSVYALLEDGGYRKRSRAERV